MPDPDPRRLAELLEGIILPMGVIPTEGAAPPNWNATYQRGPLLDQDMHGKSSGARIADDMLRETEPYPVNRWLNRANKRFPTEDYGRSFDPRRPIF